LAYPVYEDELVFMQYTLALYNKLVFISHYNRAIIVSLLWPLAEMFAKIEDLRRNYL